MFVIISDNMFTLKVWSIINRCIIKNMWKYQTLILSEYKIKKKRQLLKITVHYVHFLEHLHCTLYTVQYIMAQGFDKII